MLAAFVLKTLVAQYLQRYLSEDTLYLLLGMMYLASMLMLS